MSNCTQKFLAAVEQTIARHSMINAHDMVVVAVSGGIDSVTLLDCLVSLKERFKLRLVVAHLNHQLRAAAADVDAAFVKRLANSQGIVCEISSIDVRARCQDLRLSVQEAARLVRYEFLDSIAERWEAQKIALGHNADDNAESVLMNLFRGAGTRGLCGIPPQRDGQICRIIRPLCDVTRSEIAGYALARGLEHVEDQSNSDPKYLRNKVRNSLIPQLKKEFNPNLVQTLQRLSEVVRDEEAYWDIAVKETFQSFVIKPFVNEHNSSCLRLRRASMDALHPALLRRLIRFSIGQLKGDLMRIALTHIEAVRRLIIEPGCFAEADLPGGLYVYKEGGVIVFLTSRPKRHENFSYLISEIMDTYIAEIDTTLRLSLCGISNFDNLGKFGPNLELGSEMNASFDLDMICFPLKVRSVSPGDRFTPLGMRGSQKLKDFFINVKVPRFRRGRCPVVEDCSGKIIWVGGFRIDDSVKVTEKTKTILNACLLPGERLH